MSRPGPGNSHLATVSSADVGMIPALVAGDISHHSQWDINDFPMKSMSCESFRLLTLPVAAFPTGWSFAGVVVGLGPGR